MANLRDTLIEATDKLSAVPFVVSAPTNDDGTQMYNFLVHVFATQSRDAEASGDHDNAKLYRGMAIYEALSMGATQQAGEIANGTGHYAGFWPDVYSEGQ